MTTHESVTDSPTRPKHYKQYKYEPVAVIRDWGLGFNLGSSLKYIARAGKKDPNKHIEDLKKAIEFINIEIGFLEEEMRPEVPKKQYTDNWSEEEADTLPAPLPGVCAPGINLNTIKQNLQIEG